MFAESILIQPPGTAQPDSAMDSNPATAQRDLELVRRMQAKDEAALQELYAAYGQRLYAYALRLTGDAGQAEDILQDALVAAWQSAGSYRGEGRLIAWLMRIVHHTAIKALRRQPARLSEETAEQLTAVEPLPEERVQRSEQSAWVLRGLARLSPEHRAVLELVFYQGLSLQETAAVCDCPLGTVKSRLSYARRQLRGLLSRVEERQ